MWQLFLVESKGGCLWSCGSPSEVPGFLPRLPLSKKAQVPHVVVSIEGLVSVSCVLVGFSNVVCLGVASPCLLLHKCGRILPGEFCILGFVAC